VTYIRIVFLKNIKNKPENFKTLFLYVSKSICDCQESTHYEIFLSSTQNEILHTFTDNLKLV